MPPHDSTLDEIKSRTDIIELISEYVALKKAGQNWKGLCPFHTEKTPSFTVSPSKQIFHCFGCGKGGDIFAFLMQQENITFPEAVKILADRAGVTLRYAKRDSVKSGEKEIMLNIHRAALSFFKHNLSGSSTAKTYLNKRGINQDSLQDFSIGYAPKSWDALLTFLKKEGFKEEVIMKTGLIVRGRHGFYDTFRNRIIFPIHDLKGDVVAFGGRSIDGTDPKYLNSPETLIFNKRKILYGLSRAKSSIKEAGFAMLMEGYMDIIVAHQYGFRNAIAPLGTACTHEHAKLIRRFSEEAILVFDSDPAGAKATKTATNILLENGINVKILNMPEQEDPDSYLRKKGSDSFQALLERPLTITEFYLHQKGDRLQITGEVLEAIARVPNRVLQGEYIKDLSDKLGIEERFIIEEFQKTRKRQNSTGKMDKPLQKPVKRPLDEVYIIQLLLQLPENINGVSQQISESDFKDPVTRSIFTKLTKGVHDIETLMLDCNEHEKSFLTEISLKDDFEYPAKALNDCITRFVLNRKKRLLQEIQLKIKKAESDRDFALLKKLQKKQFEIIKSQSSL